MILELPFEEFGFRRLDILDKVIGCFELFQNLLTEYIFYFEPGEFPSLGDFYKLIV